MTSPEKTNISQAAEQMTFAADFDHNLSDQEKLEAAKKLDDLVESTLEKFRDGVNDWSNLKINDDKKEYLSLFLQVPQEDGSYLSIRVKSELSTDNTRSREIGIQEMRGIRGGEYHRYYIEDGQDGQDGQVLRFDSDFSKSARTEFERPSLQEEKDRGINHQPVGVNEIDKLAELLESAEPYK